MIESSVWRAAVAEGEAKGRIEGEAKGRVEGEAKGRAEGEIGEDRLLCVEMIRQYHPAVLDAVHHRIRACNDAARLRSWILHGPRMSDDEIVRAISASQ